MSVSDRPDANESVASDSAGVPGRETRVLLRRAVRRYVSAH